MSLRANPPGPATTVAGRRRQVYQLRLEGLAPPEIAARLRVSVERVTTDMSYLAANPPAPAQAAAIRQLIDDRLTLMLAKVMPRVLRGDLPAIKEARAIEAERARLWGVSTLKIDTTVREVSAADIELHQMIDEARAKMLAEEEHLCRQQGADHGP